MDTGVVIIQEPVFTKTSVEEAPAGVVLDHSTMEVDKANLSTALDDCRNSIVSVESKYEKEEAMKTIYVEEDSKIVKEKDNETDADEQGTTYVPEPESFNKNTNDANIILSDATLNKDKEDDSTQKLEEVIFEKPVTEEDQTETKHSQEEEKDIGNISKVFVDTAPVKSGEDNIEKSLNSTRDEISIKTDEVKEEKDSRTVDSSVNGTEIEHNATVSVEEEPSTDGVSLHDVETTRGVLLETEKEAEPRLDAKEKEETETVNKIVKDPEIVITQETIVHESISLEENAEPVEAIKNSDDAEQSSREVTGAREKEEDIIQNAEETQESLTDNEEHEHVLVRDIPQEETLVPKAESVNTSSVQESAQPSLDLKEEEGTVKTVTSSDEVQESITVIEPPKTSPDQRSKDTEEVEHVLRRNMPQDEIFVTEAESLVTQEDTEPIMDLKEDKEQEKTEKFEEVPSDLALKVDKEELKNEMKEVDQVVGAQTMERGLELNESEAEKTDRNRTDETEESAVEKLVAHPDVESVEQMEKPSLESPSEVSEEKSKTLDEKIEEKPEEEVPQHQEGQEEGSYGSETKEETVSVPESSELGETAQEERSLDLTPLQEESCLPIEKDKEETKLQKEEVHKHEPSNEEVKSDEVVEVSSASPSEEREGETVVEAKNIEEIKANEEEKVADKIQQSLETVKTIDTEPVKSNEDDVEETLSSVNEEKASRTAEDEHNATVSVEGISKNSENIVHETSPEEIKNSDEAEEISHEVTGNIEKKEDITREKEEVQESPTVIETQIIQEEKTEPKVSKDTEEHEHALVRDMPQINTLVTEAEDVNTSTVQEVETSKTLETTTNETEVGQETKEDIEPSLDLKEDKEEEETETARTVISSDEERPSDQVDVQAEESVEVKSKETLQDEVNEEKHANLLDVPSGGFQVVEPETVLVDKTEVDKVDGTQVMGEQRGLEPNEPEAEQIDRKKPDEAEKTSVVESVEKMQSPSLECPSEASEETSTTVDEKIEKRLQEEEVTLQQEGQEKASYGLEIKEETLSVPESRDLGEIAQEEASFLPKETKFQQVKIEKHEPPNDQQSPVEEKSDEVIQDSSASPSEEREGEIVVDAVKVEDIKANEKDQAEEKIQKSVEPLEIAEPQSLFPSCSEEKEQQTVSEKMEDEKVKKEEPTVQILSEDDATKSEERQEEVHKTVETTAVQKEHTRDIGSSLNEKCSMDQTQAEEQQVNEKLDEHVDSQTSVVFSEKSDNENLTAEEKKGNEETTVSDMQKGETIVTEADHEAVDASTVQKAAVLNTLETTISESEAVHSPIGGEEENQVTKEVTEPSLDLKEDKEQEETETVKTVNLSDEVIKDESQGREESVEVKPKEIVQHESTQEKDENLLDIPSGESSEKMQMQSLESPPELSEETSKTVDEKIEERPEEEVTLHQESQETKEETVPVPESSELVVQAKEDESSPPNEQEKERTLQKEKTEKNESTSEADSSTYQTPVEENSDEVVKVSSASPLEERKGETLVEAEKIEDIIKASEEEQVADKMQRSLETVETVEPHSSFPSPPEEHETVAEAEKIEDGKVKETEPMGDMTDKGLEISEAKDLSLPLEAAGSHGTESSELAAEFEEQKPNQVKEILEGEKMEVDETKAEELPFSETTPQETLSDVVPVQLKRDDNATESNERQKELSKDKEMEETKVAQEVQTRDIGTSLTEKCSMDQAQPEEQVNEESPRDEQEKASSTAKEETKTKDLEEENMDEHVDSFEKNDQETLVAETAKEDEDKTVGLDGSGTSKTSENVCIKQEEFETLEAPKLEESEENKSQEFSETVEAIESKGDQTPSFISELEDQIPKQVEEIHEEETKEDQSLEKSQDDQTPSLVSEQVEEIHEEEKETKESPCEATSGQDLPVETSQDHQTPSSKLVSELDDKAPKQIEENHEEETKEDQSLEKSQDDQTPSLVSEKVEESHEEEEETKESHKVEATSGQDLPVETSQAHQTPSSKLVSELDDKTPKKIEEIHEEETKAHSLQEEEILPTETVPRESFSEAPVSMLASGEDDQVAVQESNCAGDRQEKEESVGETKPKESEAERTEKLADKVTMVEDEDTKKTDVEVAEITKEQSMMTHAPENACVEQEELKDLETLQAGEIIEGKDSLKNDNSDDFTFSTETGEAEHVDETSSNLPVVGILKELQTTLEKSEREVNDSEAESCGIDLHSIKAEPAILEKNLVVEESPASEIIEANMLQQDERGETEKIQEENGLADKSLPVEELKLQEEHKEVGKVQDSISREFEVDVEEKLQEETREIAEFKEETPADRSLKEAVTAEQTPLPSEDLEHVVSSEKQVEQEPQQDTDASTSEKISLKEEDPTDFETSKKEQNAETHETVKEEDQVVDIQEEKKNEVRDEKLSGLSATKDTEETFSSEVKKDQEDESELGVGHDSDTLQVGKEEEAHSVLGNDHEINEVVTPEKQITDPMGVVKKASEAEYESNEEHVESQAISDDTKSNNDRDFPTEEAPKDQREDVNANTSSTKEAFDVQVKDQPKDFEAPVTDKDTTEEEKKSNDLIYVHEDVGTNVKPEVRDSVVAQKEETGLIEEKSEVDYVKTEPEDAIRHGDSTEEKHKASEKIDEEATKEMYQEERKQTDTVAAIKDEIKEEEKETTHESFNTKKNTDDATEKTTPEIPEIKNSSSISDTQDKSSKFEKQETKEPKQKDEVPNQHKREIADEVPKLESLKTAEELQQRDGESEPTVKEPARKSLSDLIQKVKGTDKTEVATTEPRIEEEAKAEEQDEDGEEHKDDKTSPDSIVMVEAKDTVSIIKTHKKSQGILSGVGSKVKHSISKVKKALTGKSSHTTKPSSPQ